MQLFLVLFLLSPHVAMVTAWADCTRDRDKDHRTREDCTALGFRDVPAGFEPTTQVMLFPKNLFSSLSWYSFKIFTEIYEIDLSGNKIAEVTPSVTPILPTLSVLRLGSNQLTSLSDGSFSACPALTELYLDNNALNSLSDHTFSGLSKLEILDLSSNHIRVLPGLMLHPLSVIETIYLENNKIMVMPDDWFSPKTEVPYLFLSVNPWACSCALGYLRRYLEDYEFNVYVRDGKIIISDGESVVCDSPQRHKSKPLLSLEESDLCSTATESNPTGDNDMQITHYRTVAATIPDTTPAPTTVPPAPTTVPPAPTTVPPAPTTVPPAPTTVPPVPPAPTTVPPVPPAPTTVPPAPTTVPPAPTTVPPVPPAPTTVPPAPTTVPPVPPAPTTVPPAPTTVPPVPPAPTTVPPVPPAPTTVPPAPTTVPPVPPAPTTVPPVPPAPTTVPPIHTTVPTATTSATVLPLFDWTTFTPGPTVRPPTKSPANKTSTKSRSVPSIPLTTPKIRVLTTTSANMAAIMLTPASGRISAVRGAGVFCFWLFVGCLLLCVVSAVCALVTLVWLVHWYRRVYKPLSMALVKRGGGGEAVRILTYSRVEEQEVAGGGVMAWYRSVLFANREEEEALKGDDGGKEGEGGTERLLVTLEPTGGGGGAMGEEEEDKSGTEEKGVFKKTMYRLVSKEKEIEGWRDVMEECRVSAEGGGGRRRGEERSGGEVSKKCYSVILREEREEAGGVKEELDWVVGGWEVKTGGEEPRSSWGEWLQHYQPSMPWGVTTPPEGEAAQ